MTEKQLEKKDEKTTEESSNEVDDFSYEVSSTFGDMEIVEEILHEQDQELSEISEEIPLKKTIKIISEKNMEIKEIPPPNYYQNFICALHFKNKDYKQRKKILTELIDE